MQPFSVDRPSSTVVPIRADDMYDSKSVVVKKRRACIVGFGRNDDESANIGRSAPEALLIACACFAVARIHSRRTASAWIQFSELASVADSHRSEVPDMI